MTRGSSSGMDLTSQDASVRFSKPNDRFEHSFCIGIGATWVAILNSYVNDPLASWPTDPAIQQLVVESIGQDPFPDVALGVGMSGKGHWSLAAQWMGRSESHRAFQFDYACKIQPPVGFLGSTYAIPQELSAQGIQLERYQVSAQHWTGWFAISKLHSRYRLAIEVTQGKLTWHADTQQIAIEPESDSVRSLEKPSTLRWCYRVAWLSCQE